MSLSKNKQDLSVSPKSMVVQGRHDPAQPSAGNGGQVKPQLRMQSYSGSHAMHLRDRGKGALSPQISSGKKRSVPGKSSLAGCLKEPKLEPCVLGLPKQDTTSHGLVKHKDEEVTCNVSQLEVPIVVIQPVIALAAMSSKGMQISLLDGSVNSQFDEKVVPHQEPLPPPYDGMDNCILLKEKASENNCGTHEEIKDNDREGTKFQQSLGMQERHLTPEVVRSHHYVSDITKGQERVAISLVNEVNDEPPPSFNYIPRNTVFQNAYFNFSLARIGDNSCSTCSGDCLSLSMPCACSHETGGEFAYTSDGLVKEELLEECISMNRDPEKHCQYFCKECPLERSNDGDIVGSCKGHLVRNFIKECWLKCGCNIQCGNRVVQRGITRKLQVYMTPSGKGWGLRTLEDLPKGVFVCEYVGEVLTNAELYDRVSQSSEGEVHSYPVLLDADWGSEVVLKDEEALCLDATYYGNVARFINHRCEDSNMVEIPVEVETPDRHYYHLAFFTTRKVKAMEELTWDYGIDFDDHSHPVKAFHCHCGSRFCRGLKRRSRSRSTRR